MKKISFFIGSLHGGGAEKVISILANHYQTIGWNVAIVLLLDSQIKYEVDPRIQIIDFTQAKNGSYFKYLPKWLIKIRQYVKKETPDRIVSFVGRINVLVLTACLGLHIPIIVSERNDPKHDGRSPMMLRLCNWSYKRATVVVYQTKYEQTCFSSKLKNGVIIGNPISLTATPQLEYRQYEIVTAGRLSTQKNQKMLIDAIALLSTNYPQISLNIYGEGDLKEILWNQIKSLNLTNRIRLCGNVSDLHQKICQSGIFVLCSEYEGLSNALIEAMALGLPCISTDYPGVRELIIDGENGLIVPCDDAKQLALAIEKLLTQQELRKKISLNGMKTSKLYENSVILKHWEKIIGN